MKKKTTVELIFLIAHVKMKTNKEEIIRAAAQLFFSQGYEATSTSQIAKAVNLSNNSCLFSGSCAVHILIYKKVRIST